MCDDAKGCRCHVAVTRVYREMLARETPEIVAFDAAATVYRHYHPEVAPKQARFTIAEWLEDIA